MLNVPVQDGGVAGVDIAQESGGDGLTIGISTSWIEIIWVFLGIGAWVGGGGGGGGGAGGGWDGTILGTSMATYRVWTCGRQVHVPIWSWLLSIWLLEVQHCNLHWLSPVAGGNPLDPKKPNFLKHWPSKVNRNIINKQTILKSIDKDVFFTWKSNYHAT